MASGTLKGSAEGTPEHTASPERPAEPPEGLPEDPAESFPAPQYFDPLLGKTIAERYFIEKTLGAGGMGSVYLARHITLDKQFALKVLHGEFVRRPDLVERFLQEARAASRIRHDNVIDITDFGSTPDGVVFFAMEVLEGHDLHDEIVWARKEARAIPWPRSRRIFLQVCSALAAAHACGVIHRDLKPENVYLIERLGQTDFVKLLDFGIAKLSESAEGERRLTRTGMLFGTPEYMAPEQARGETVDHRVDVYAMGCLLYQLIAGRVPFAGENFMSVLTMHMTAEPPAIPREAFEGAGAPPALAGVIARALVKERDARFASMEEMIAAIEAVEADVQEEVAAAVPVERWPESSRPVSDSMSIPAHAPAEVAEGTAEAPLSEEGGAEGEQAEEGQYDEARSETMIGVRAGSRRSRMAMWLVTALVLLVSVGLGGLVLADWAGWESPWPGPWSGGAGTEASLTAPEADQASADPAVALTTAPEGEPPVPARVTLNLRSEPEGATVSDSRGNVIGETPIAFDIPGGYEPRRFRFGLAGHYDKLVELIPEEDIAYTVTLAPRPAAVAGQGAAAHAAESEARAAASAEVEIVPQERARRRRQSRRAARARRAHSPESERSSTTPQTSAEIGEEPGTGGQAGQGPEEEAGESTPPGEAAGATGADETAGERPADISDPTTAGATGEEPAVQDPSAPPGEPGDAAEPTEPAKEERAPAEEDDSGTDQDSTDDGSEREPKPRDPSPASDPVLKNPFAQ